MPTLTSTPIQRAATVAMDTLITIQVVTDQDAAQVQPVLQRALHWFTVVEQACSRFDPNSELRQCWNASVSPTPPNA